MFSRKVLPLEDCLECIGGVGGRSGTPILREACFKVRGLELWEVGLDGIPVSTDKTRGFDAKAMEYVSDERSSRGCGNVLCRFSMVELSP
jgi:hypothetical protein